MKRTTGIGSGVDVLEDEKKISRQNKGGNAKERLNQRVRLYDTYLLCNFAHTKSDQTEGLFTRR